MKTYAAVSQLNEGQHVPALTKADNYPYILTSFIYDPKQRAMTRLPYPIVGMLDSGAHSVWSRGETVNFDAYIDWCVGYAKINPNLRIVNLDVIPGSKGVTPTTRERKKAVKQSVENAEALRAAGLRVIEVMHLFDPFEAWEAMIERRRPGEVLGIGGFAEAVRTNAATVQAFGDACFAKLRDMHGWDALPPVHGFGVSVTQVAYRYPLSSIDATSWVAPFKFGQVLERDRLQRRDRHSEHLRSLPVAISESVKILRWWRKREQQLNAFWADRGVRILEEGTALV